MSELLKKAQTHLRIAEKTDGPDNTQMLRWATVYSLVAIAEGVWKLVELMREVHPSEAHRIDRHAAGTDTHDPIHVTKTYDGYTAP